MNIHVLKNQGYCNGVKRALELVEKASKNHSLKRPIYLLGNLIHNIHIDSYIESLGIIQLKGTSRLKMLEEITTGTVIFTAHGVSSKVKQEAIAKGLDIIDATCPVVKKSEENISLYAKKGYTILFIGKKNHPESITIKDDIPNSYIIDPQSINLPKNLNKVAVSHQTTMSSYDINHIYDQIKKTYKDAVIIPSLCNITELRQLELSSLKITNDTSLIIVIGDPLSNNSNKLYEQAKRKTNAIFISDKSELDLNYINKFTDIYIASGTSTPNYLIDEVVELLETR